MQPSEKVTTIFVFSRPVHLRNRHFFYLDVIALLLLPAFALVLRVEHYERLPRQFYGLFNYTLFALTIRLLCYYLFGLYRHHWRYASINEMVDITFMVFISTSIIVASFFLGRLAGLPIFSLPRSVPFIDGLLAVCHVGGSRFIVRILERWRLPRPEGDAKRVLIMGAGDAGAMIARELQNNPRLGLQAVGFLDDDASKHGIRIHNIPVLGTRDTIPRLVTIYNIAQVIIAMPTAPGKTIREITRICEAAGARTKIIPSMYELLDGTVSVNQLRDVDIEDLLRREPVKTEIGAVAELIRDRCVLVTGAGGSIGSELCRQILRFGPRDLVLMGHGENSIFAIHHELRNLSQGQTAIHPVIADTRFPERVKWVCESYRPDIIFHTAAHKHVPLMEWNPPEAISNNVRGTRCLLKAALATGVGYFVMISTDKAVNPSSVMGASKRAAELLVNQAAQQSGRPYVAVRFGNVLGSRGSVIWTFKRQIANGGPVTVTHPDIERFFMTIPEAVQLVLQASVLGHGGEVFVLDMGNPVKIADLAHDLIELSGLEVNQDIDIVYTGLRPGDKLYEELFVTGESYRRTRHDKIFITNNSGNHTDPAALNGMVDALEEAAASNNSEAIIHLLQRLIPEYRPVEARTIESPLGHAAN